MESDAPIVVWVHDDGRRITVYADHKHRSGFGYGPGVDVWPVLTRNTVPALTDQEWVASPGAGWIAAVEPGPV